MTGSKAEGYDRFVMLTQSKARNDSPTEPSRAPRNIAGAWAELNAMAKPRMARKKAATNCRAAKVPLTVFLQCGKGRGILHHKVVTTETLRQIFQRHSTALSANLGVMRIETRAVHAGRKPERGTRD